MLIEIKSRFTGEVIVSGDYQSVRECLEKNRGADLGGADLGGADLGGANLIGADLRDADLVGADLIGACLRGTCLRGACLRDIKNYSQSHSIFAELIHRQKADIFTEAEWSAIAQIMIYDLCWSSIRKRFATAIPHVFEILAHAGWREYLDYWNELVKGE